jgi:hypothetical protein
MSTAFILVPPPYLRRDAYFAGAKPQLIAAFQDNRYSTLATIEVGELTGTAAADELFDLTNNPGRQAEREEKYGRGPSLSVGDIVKMGNEAWLCQSIGWVQIAPVAKKPSDYKHIAAWGYQLGSFLRYIEGEQEKAFAAGAPINAIFQRHATDGSGPTGEWATADTIKDDDVRRIIERAGAGVKKEG